MLQGAGGSLRRDLDFNTVSPMCWVMKNPTALFAALAAICMALAAPAPARANPYSELVRVELLPGWRRADGEHIAALHLTLAEGWKTYWRAPGDAGIPPLFDWSQSRNLRAAMPVWPTPVVFSQNGMRSIGYKRDLVLPLRVTPDRAGREIRLDARLQIGICNDICVPVDLTVTGALPDGGRPDPRIVSALADIPVPAAEAGVRVTGCTLSPTPDGLRLTARVAMPQAGRAEALVIETADPEVWVAEPRLSRESGTLVAETELMHIDGGAFALDRSGLRLTVLGRGQAVDIRGCPAP